MKLDLSIPTLTLIVFITQILFLYFETLNIRAIVARDLWRAVWTGWFIGITWMFGTAIGVGAVINGDIWPILGHLTGGTVGVVIALKLAKRNEERDK